MTSALVLTSTDPRADGLGLELAERGSGEAAPHLLRLSGLWK
jgi:hypothetical protein